MLDMIARDFDVKPISRGDNASLYAARRADVWHIVLATTKRVAPNHESIDIGQFHWPRYSVARALASTGSTIPALVQQLGIRSAGEVATVSLRGGDYPVSESFVEAMRQDIPLLEKAAATVKVTSEGFEVSEAKTSRGYPVVAEQRSLAEAIAFERETRKKLDPRNFGVYSAFCTWRDFIRDDPSRKESIAAGMAEEMLTWDPATFGDEAYWESVFIIQERLWGARIWGPGVDCAKDVLLDAFSRAFERLSSIQFAQLVLMNGMHMGGSFHPLATLFGLIDFAGYKYWRTREFQPDSEDEQKIRMQSSFIELLGIADS